jgi:hypothetical protein
MLRRRGVIGDGELFGSPRPCALGANCFDQLEMTPTAGSHRDEICPSTKARPLRRAGAFSSKRVAKPSPTTR